MASSGKSSGILTSRLGRNNIIKPLSKKTDIFESVFGGAVDLNSDRGQKLLNQKSLNAETFDGEEDEKLNKKFSTLEKKEWISEQQQQVLKITVSAYHCATCSYVLEEPIAKCGAMGHDITLTKATKRCFACQHCKNRQCLLNARTPTAPCRKCNAMLWKKCSLYREKGGKNTTQEVFQPRGEKQVNSLRFAK